MNHSAKSQTLAVIPIEKSAIGKARQSNFELLRIVAIFGIIIYHVMIHGVLNDANSFTTSASLYAVPHFFPKLSIFPLVAILGDLGNNIFILLSGYFLFGKKVNFTGQSKKILTQMTFATLILIIISFIMLELAVHGLLPWWKPANIQIVEFDFFNNGGWFLGYYLLIILLGKLFLNARLEKMMKSTWYFMLSAELAIICIGSIHGFLDSFVQAGQSPITPSTMVLGIFLYTLGAYIRKYNPFDKIKTWVLLTSSLFLIILPVWSFYENTKLAIFKYVPGTIFHQTHLTDVYAYMGGIIILLLGVIIFELFRRVKPFTSKTVNYIASATLMIYLVHDSTLGEAIYKKDGNWEQLLMYRPKQFILNVIIFVLIYFAVGFAVYVLYDQFTRKLWPKIKRIALKNGGKQIATK